MQFQFLPTLETLRQLYRMPRDMQRFRWYTSQMLTTGDTADVLLPISLVNPMGQEHCLEAVEALIRAGAEDAVKDGIAVAEAKLGAIPGSARVSLNLLDDEKGGWTERYQTEAGLTFGSLYAQRANRRRRFVIVPAWSSERGSSDDVYRETLAACYRQAWRDIMGLPRDLEGLLRQEGAVLSFAGIEPLSIPLSSDEEQAVAALAEEHGSSTSYPVQFAFFFGDEAATACGYPPLGIAASVGPAFALARANRERIDPVALLVQAGASR